MTTKRAGRIGIVPKILIVAIIVAIAVGGVYAFTAGNTVPTSQVGEGQAVVSGYDVSSVHYNLNAANPALVDSVTFNLDSAPLAGSTIRAKLIDTGNDYYTCSNVGVSVTCSTTSPQARVADTNHLTVIVAQ